MKKLLNLSICFLFCISLLACTGPGTGPGGVYTEADRQRDQTNTALAIGAAAVGTAVVGTAVYNAGRHDAYHPPPGPGYRPPPPPYRPPPPPPRRW